MENLEGRVAVVTGAASGIGLATASRFAREGMRVMMSDIQGDALDAAVAQLRGEGLEVTGVVTDVSKVEQVESLARHTLDTYGAVMHGSITRSSIASAKVISRPVTGSVIKPLSASHFLPSTAAPSDSMLRDATSW